MIVYTINTEIILYGLLKIHKPNVPGSKNSNFNLVLPRRTKQKRWRLYINEICYNTLSVSPGNFFFSQYYQPKLQIQFTS